VEDKENNIMGEFMNLTDLKIWGLSSFALTINLMDVEVSLSVILSVTAIGYTLHKWYILYKRDKYKK
jgi:hypothetical protein